MSTYLAQVWRDAEGSVINIGPWDFMYLAVDADTIVVTNPVPTGAYSEMAEIEILENGARRPVDLEV